MDKTIEYFSNARIEYNNYVNKATKHSIDI